MKILNEIAAIGAHPENLPSPETDIGRECYALSDVEDKAIAFLQRKAEELFQRYGITEGDYEIKQDAFGNLFVTYFGEDRSKTVASGSHIDSVKNGGMYDGVAGIFSAYNFLEKILKQGKKPKKNYAAIVFRAEESSPATGIACLGSSVATGIATRKQLEEATYFNGVSKVPFPEFFIKKYGIDRWNAVLDELDNPPIKPDSFEVWEELHIEQSAVLQELNKEVGIVDTGVGGSKREEYNFSSENFSHISLDVNEKNPHDIISVSFLGQSAHTAGTPPNPASHMNHDYDGNWYRKDALVCAAHFTRICIKRCREKKIPFYVLSCNVPSLTGFTTVPSRQDVRFCFPSSRLGDVESIFHDVQKYLNPKQDIVYNVSRTSADFGIYSCLDTKQVSSVLDAPLIFERLARLYVQKQGGFGKVRSTVTDFRLDSNGVYFNVDYRSVDVAEFDMFFKNTTHIVKNIFRFLKNYDPHLLSSKTHANICSVCTSIKERIAETLNLSFVKMPSMPGHDAVSFGHAGIPITMTFVRHDGVSHDPHENMNLSDYRNAEKLSHAFLEHVLGIDHSELPSTQM